MNKIFILGAATLILSSCSTYRAANTNHTNDDLYYSLEDADKPVYNKEVEVERQAAPEPVVQEEYISEENTVAETPDYSSYKREDASQDYEPAEQTRTTADDGNTYVTNNYYSNNYEDDYYATRIQRFHNPYIGFGYYSPAYAGYYYDPFYSGFSISFGYTWGSPCFDPWYAWYCRPYYYPYAYYDPFYSPWYHHSYRNGYWNGYWDGYNDGLYNGYYGGGNGGGGKTTYYRPRPNRGGDYRVTAGRDQTGSSTGTGNVQGTTVTPTSGRPQSTEPTRGNSTTPVVKPGGPSPRVSGQKNENTSQGRPAVPDKNENSGRPGVSRPEAPKPGGGTSRPAVKPADTPKPAGSTPGTSRPAPQQEQPKRDVNTGQQRPAPTPPPRNNFQEERPEQQAPAQQQPARNFDRPQSEWNPGQQRPAQEPAPRSNPQYERPRYQQPAPQAPSQPRTQESGRPSAPASSPSPSGNSGGGSGSSRHRSR